MQVFNAIREAQPTKLFVIADGPRMEYKEDHEKCSKTRAIIDLVDWECEVLTNYSDKNMGCKVRVTTGLDWVFDHVEEAIILEDDCLPHATFFRFCQELLVHYRNDQRVMIISGDNFQFGKKRTEYSYYFSRHPHIWGWATWKRAWEKFDVNMELWPMFRDSKWLDFVLDNRNQVSYWSRLFDDTYSGKIDAWSYALLLACWIQSGLAILPASNLVSNIGFGNEGTHTTSIAKYANMAVYPAIFPLKHPPFVIRHFDADQFTFQDQYNNKSISKILFRIYMRVRSVFI
jgi:hypothetical protein